MREPLDSHRSHQVNMAVPNNSALSRASFRKNSEARVLWSRVYYCSSDFKLIRAKYCGVFKRIGITPWRNIGQLGRVICDRSSKGCVSLLFTYQLCNKPVVLGFKFISLLPADSSSRCAIC